MKTRLIAMLAGLALAGSALAQQPPGPIQDAGAPAPAHDAHIYRYFAADGVPPLPPDCQPERFRQSMRRHMPDFSANAKLRSTLGISQAQAEQVAAVMKQSEAQRQKLREEHSAEAQATCAKLRAVIGDKAMERWAEASMLPPPRPPMAPMPPAPPQPPMPPPPPVDQ